MILNFGGGWQSLTTNKKAEGLEIVFSFQAMYPSTTLFFIFAHQALSKIPSPQTVWIDQLFSY